MAAFYITAIGLLSFGLISLMISFEVEEVIIVAIPALVAGILCLVAGIASENFDYDNGKDFVTSRAATPEDALRAYKKCITNPASEDINDAVEWRKGCVDGARERGLVFKLDESGKDVVTAG